MDLVNIAMSGLNSNRVALDVASQNVANVNTPGYSRQEALMASVGGDPYNHQDAGNGVNVTNIRRVADKYLVRQTWGAGSHAAYADQYAANFSQMENTLGADGFSINAGLDSLYAALNDATSRPESIPLRQQIINESEAISRRFNTLTAALHNHHKDLSEQRLAVVAHANSILNNIAQVNQQIVEMKGTGGNSSKLYDTRDHLIGQLSNLMEIRSTEQPDGSLQVALRSGQPLVIGGEAGNLQAVPDKSDAYMARMQIVFSDQTFQVPEAIGGKLGAMNDYQTKVLKPNILALDDMAAALAKQFNAVLSTGIDLNGHKGAALFTYDPGHPAASLNISAIDAKDLALSSDGTPGNSDKLAELIKLSNKPVAVRGFGSESLNDAFTSMVGATAIKSRQAEADSKANQAMKEQAVKARDDVSAVNSDEEAANLMTFANAHNANMKVISTANRLFDTVLQLF